METSLLFGYAKVKNGDEGMAVKNKIRGYRNMLGMTQEQLGAKLGITKQAYQRKEVGRAAFSDLEKLTFKKLLLPLFPNITLEDIFF